MDCVLFRKESWNSVPDWTWTWERGEYPGDSVSWVITPVHHVLYAQVANNGGGVGLWIAEVDVLSSGACGNHQVKTRERLVLMEVRTLDGSVSAVRK